MTDYEIIMARMNSLGGDNQGPWDNGDNEWLWISTTGGGKIGIHKDDPMPLWFKAALGALNQK